jgi:hypothetical protein
MCLEAVSKPFNASISRASSLVWLKLMHQKSSLIKIDAPKGHIGAAVTSKLSRSLTCAS